MLPFCGKRGIIAPPFFEITCGAKSFGDYPRPRFFKINYGASRVSLRQRTTFVALPPTTLTLRATDFVGRAVGEGGAIIIFEST